MSDTDIEKRIARSLSAYRREQGATAPPPAVWDRITPRVKHPLQRTRRVLVPLAATTIALAVIVIAIELPRAAEHAISPHLVASLGKLIYERHGTTPNPVTGFDYNTFISRDLRTGREHVLATGVGCGYTTQVDPSRRHVAYCGSDGTQILDLETGEVTHVKGYSGWAADQIGWTQSGALLLSVASNSPSSPSLLSYANGRVSVVYGPSTPILGAGVVPLADGIVATTQCHKTCDANDSVNLIVERPGSHRVLFKRRNAFPIEAFEGGRGLLFGVGIYGKDRQRLGVLHVGPDRTTSLETGVDPSSFGGPFDTGSESGPDGLVAITGGDRTHSMVSIFDTRSLKTRRITKGIGPVVWTPDGHGIVYQYGNAIRVTDLNGRSQVLVRGDNIRPITVTEAPRVPSAEMLAYLSLHSTGRVVDAVHVMSMDMHTGRTTTIAAGGPCGDFGTPIDPDTTRVALCEYAPSVGNPSMFDLTTHRKIAIPNGYGWPVAWNTNGNLLLLTGGPDSKVFELVDGSPVLVYEPKPSRWIFGVVPLGNGDLGVTQSTTESCDHGCASEWLIARDQQRLYPIDGEPLVAFNEGQDLLFQTGPASGKPGALEILRADHGEYVRRTTGLRGSFGNAQYLGAVVGPDGRIAIAGEREGQPLSVYVFDPRTLSLRRIATGGGPLAWMPDGHGVVYSDIDLHTIRMADLDGRNRVLVRGDDVRALAVVDY